MIAIVGAGVTGLACADALARAGEGVALLDRIPASGGVAGWGEPRVAALTARVRAAGTRLALGVTALRWDGEALLGLGPEGALRVRARTLVVATGARPLGRAELGITGERPAGVLPATVACHLAESGLVVGADPVVYGGGDWAARACAELLHAGVRRIRLLAPEGARRAFPEAVHVLEGARAASLEGSPRVRAVVLEDGRRLTCDALVLAHGLAPLRNVEGAVEAGERTVYAQPLAEVQTIEDAIAAGRAAAQEVLSR